MMTRIVQTQQHEVSALRRSKLERDKYYRATAHTYVCYPGKGKGSLATPCDADQNPNASNKLLESGSWNCVGGGFFFGSSFFSSALSSSSA
jgi:hypothetical protein